MLLEQNGKASSGKRTRHINIRYFFVKDRIDSGDIRVTYCPTDDMVADFFTKPLQGSAFMRFRNFLLNVDSSIDATKNLRSVLGNISTGPGHEETHAQGTSHDSVKTVTFSGKECVGTDDHKNDVENPWFLVKGKGVNKKRCNTAM